MLNGSNIFSMSHRLKVQRDLLDSLNLNLNSDYGLYLREEDYNNHVKDMEVYVSYNLKFGDIFVIKEGELDFFYYGGFGISEAEPSRLIENENFPFYEGIRCYNADVHIPLELDDNTFLYEGKFVGKYIECVFASNSLPGLGKDYGRMKEYVLLTDTPVKIKLFK